MSKNSNSTIIRHLKLLEKKKLTGKYWNISWRSGEILSDLVSQSNPKTVLEIGTSNGFSTLWIANKINENSKIYTIEVNEKRFNEAKQTFEECKLKNIVQIKGEALDTIYNNEFKSKFDFVFLDAAHKYYKEIILALSKLKLIKENTTIVADNILTHLYMEKFVEFMKTKSNCEIIKTDSGFLVCRSFQK